MKRRFNKKSCGVICAYIYYFLFLAIYIQILAAISHLGVGAGTPAFSFDSYPAQTLPNQDSIINMTVYLGPFLPGGTVFAFTEVDYEVTGMQVEQYIALAVPDSYTIKQINSTFHMPGLMSSTPYGNQLEYSNTRFLRKTNNSTVLYAYTNYIDPITYGHYYSCDSENFPLPCHYNITYNGQEQYSFEKDYASQNYLTPLPAGYSWKFYKLRAGHAYSSGGPVFINNVTAFNETITINVTSSVANKYLLAAALILVPKEVCIDADVVGANCNLIENTTAIVIYAKPPCIDPDKDGYGALGTDLSQCAGSTIQPDCSDDNTDINPSTQEICDGKDNDCDGLIDEGCDKDWDGYIGTSMPCSGNPVCATPDGNPYYGTCHGCSQLDCDDNNELIHPNAQEICDGLDNDCDVPAQIDEGCDLNAAYVFTTFGTMGVNGGGNLGGLDGADAACMQEAAVNPFLNSKISTGSTFKAWLSSSTVDAKDRLSHSNVPYKLVDGTMVADNWDDLVTDDGDGNFLKNAINKDALGRMPQFPGLVWTATNMSGTNYGLHTCSDWTSLSGGGEVGEFGRRDSIWTLDAMDDCFTGAAHLYCFESKAYCGNDYKEGTEACDGTDLAGQTCAGLGLLAGGTPACKADCTGFDTTGCTKEDIAYVSIPKIANVYKAQLVITGANAQNPTIDAGDDGAIDWRYSDIDPSGVLNNKAVADIAPALMSLLQGCTEPEHGICRIPLKFGIDGGSMAVSDFDIEYTDYYWNTTLFPDGRSYRIRVSVSEARG